MRGTPVRQVDFRGGVNTKASPELVGQNEARDARNVVSTTRGSIRKRDGCSTFSSPAAECATLAPSEATAARVLVGVTTANDIIKIDSGGTAASIKGAATSTVTKWSVASMPPIGGQGPVYMMNGTDTPLQWTGAGNVATWTAAAGTLPNGKYIIAHGNRMWVANVPAAGTSDPGSTLYWSDLGDPRTWTAANVNMLDPNDGDEITGLGKVGSYLLVFKRRKTFLIYDSDIGANRRISDSVGCCSNRSITETPSGTFFLTLDRGVYRTDGSRMDLVSDNVAPTISALSTTQREGAAGAFFNDHYYLSAGSVTLDYDATLGSWWLHDFVANQWAVMRFSSSTDLYAANASVAKVSKAFVSGTTQDNSANFTAYWKGPWQTFGAPFLRKRLRGLRLDGIGPLDVYLAQNFQAGQSLVAAGVCPTTSTTFGGTDTFGGSYLYGDASTTQEAKVYGLGDGGVSRAWSVVFQAATNTAMEVDGYTMLYSSRRN
jgi:hypothetical protein